jgi:hypothetical protein
MMDQADNWADRLNISQEQLKSWQEEAPADTPLLVWCLSAEKISFKEYALWAKNHYGLPILNHDFFSKHPVNLPLEDDHWTPWLVPLAKWENLTYVGCVVPPSDPEENLVYVIAHPKDLEGVYAQLNPSSAPKETAVDFEMPEGLVLDPIKSEPTKIETPVSDALSDAPQGLNLDLTAPPPLPTEEAPAAAFEAPEGLSGEDVIPTQVNVEAPQAPEETEAAPAGDMNQWWEEAQPWFENAVLLQGDEKDLKVTWVNGQPKADGVQLTCSAPNIFRIVLRTKKPYHGFVVENEIHSQFFNSLGLKEYPPVVTALLVQEGDLHQILVLYGFTGEAEEHLEKAEAVAAGLQRVLTSASTSAPPAQAAA